MAKSEETDNLALWSRVCETDPEHVKHVSYGKRKYDAINPQQQAKAATREFGGYGSGWGLDELNYTWHPFGDGVVLSLEAKFFYHDEHGMAEFPIAADMPYQAGDDCYKKLRTQCQSKALSLLGFNADVFQGDWELPGYPEKMRRKFMSQESRLQAGLAKIEAARSEGELIRIESYAKEQWDAGDLAPQVYSKLAEAIDARRQELGASK